MDRRFGLLPARAAQRGKAARAAAAGVSNAEDGSGSVAAPAPPSDSEDDTEDDVLWEVRTRARARKYAFSLCAKHTLARTSIKAHAHRVPPGARETSNGQLGRCLAGRT